MSSRLFIGLLLALVGCKSDQGVTLQDDGSVAPDDGEEETEWTAWVCCWSSVTSTSS